MKFQDLRIGMIVESSKYNLGDLPEVGTVVDIAYEYPTEILCSAKARGEDLSKIRVLPVVKFLSDPSTPRKVAIENIEIYKG
jgi:hypothetical protein